MGKNIISKRNIDLGYFWCTNFWTFGFQTPPPPPQPLKQNSAGALRAPPHPPPSQRAPVAEVAGGCFALPCSPQYKSIYWVGRTLVYNSEASLNLLTTDGLTHSCASVPPEAVIVGALNDRSARAGEGGACGRRPGGSARCCACARHHCPPQHRPCAFSAPLFVCPLCPPPPPACP